MANVSTHEVVNHPVWYKALTLSERLALLRGRPADAQGGTFDPERAERRFQAWKAQPPFDKGTTFAERLALDGLTEEDLLLLLGQASDAGQAHAIPDWLSELALACEQTASSATSDGS